MFAIVAMRDSILQALRPSLNTMQKLLYSLPFAVKQLFGDVLDNTSKEILVERVPLLPFKKRSKCIFIFKAPSSVPGASASRQSRRLPLSGSKGNPQG